MVDLASALLMWIKKSEGAADMGGFIKEFVRLVLQEVMSSSIFGGHENEKYLTKGSECVM